MENNKLLRFSSLALIFGFALAVSCKDEEEKISAQDSTVITEEASTESYFQEMDDMAGVAIAAPSDNQYNGGRVSTTITVNDDRFKCSGVVVTLTIDPNSSQQTPKGVLAVDFGTTGCTDLKGNVRTGKLIFTYSGKRFQSGSSIVTTTENYTINGIKLQGTRTITNTTSATVESPNFTFTSILVDGKATFPDNTVASRSSNIKCTWVRTSNALNDELVIDHTSAATGQTRAGRSYVVSLLEDLTFKRFCGIAVSGTKHYLIDSSKEFTIDYGDGSCDKKVVISSGDVSREITVN